MRIVAVTASGGMLVFRIMNRSSVSGVLRVSVMAMSSGRGFGPRYSPKNVMNHSRNM